MVVRFCASVTVKNTGLDSVVSGLSVTVLVVIGEFRFEPCAMVDALEPLSLGATEGGGGDAVGEVEAPEPPDATVPWTCVVRIGCDEEGTVEGGAGSALILVERIETVVEGGEALDMGVREGGTEVGVGGSGRGMDTSDDDWVCP